MMRERIRILFLAANSSDDNRRYLEQELSEIDRGIQSGGQYRDCLELIPKFFVRPEDLQEVLLRHQPHIIHFSGQGTEAQGLILQSDAVDSQPVENVALTSLFHTLKDNIRIAIFNACYSAEQAAQIKDIFDFIIGMSGLIEDEARIAFSAAFYRALTYDRTVKEAFALAQTELMLEARDSYSAPVITTRAGFSDADVFSLSSICNELVSSEAGVADPTSARVFEHVRRLSEIAARDARFIVDDAAGTLGGEVRLDQNLYVHRKIEERISKTLTSERFDSALMLVVGEAGRGKTSFLWYLYEQLEQDHRWQPWFIKSTLFLGRQTTQLTSAGPWTQFAVDDLLLAARRTPDSRQVVLLDTVDLLLRDATDRDFLLELIQALLDQGCFVVATCRPQESVLLSSVGSVLFTLREYDEEELREAITKHSERFYAASIRHSYMEESSRVLDSVARGLPVREVCANPLTLRMLFTIYAPAAIPDDINIFELYEQYWTNRVERDYRAGSPIAPIPSANLAETAAYVALAMLAEGTPELELQRLHNVLKGRRNLSENISALVSRSVLHASEVGTISFFHQTFFEHSAARGLLMLPDEMGRSLLYERMLRRPHDLFIAAIYEQLLLLAEHEHSLALKRAEEALVELLGHESLAFRSSGVYVYAHKRNGTPVLTAAMARLLAEAEESLIVRFLSLAPNISDRRMETLFAELNIIWKRDKWREHDHVLRLLERLVPRDFQRIKSFIEEHSLISYLLTRPAGFTGERKLLRMLTALAEYDPAWSQKLLVQLYVEGVSRAESRDLQAAVIDALCARAALFGATEIASRLEEETAHLDLDRSRNFAILSSAWARLLRIEWQARKRSVVEILEEISQIPGGLKLLARMRALALILLESSESDAVAAFACFQAEVGTSREWLWIRIVWPLVLGGRDADALPGADHDGSVSPSVRFIRTEFHRLLREGSAARNAHSGGALDRFAQLLTSAIREATLSTEVLLALLDVPELSETNIWLEHEGYAPLLIDAFVAGHPGAILAMSALLENPGKHWPGLADLLRPKFAGLMAKGGRALDFLLTLAIKLEDHDQLLRLLEQATEPLPVSFHDRKDQLSGLRLRFMASSSARTRQTAVLIWYHLLRLKLAHAPALFELRDYFKHETDARIRGQLIALMGESAVDANDVDDVVAFLGSLARAGEIDIRERALAALARIVAEDTANVSRFTPSVLEAALTEPTNAARLSLMRPLIEKLIAIDVNSAAQVFATLVTEARRAGLGINGSRKLLGRFKPTVRRLVRAAALEVRRDLMKLVPGLDRVLGVLVVDAICHHGLGSMTKELEALIGADIHSDVKEVVLRYKYFYERTMGGEDWPELYDLIRDKT